MANILKVKRSSVPGRVPSTSDLQLGELAINTNDGKLYTKKSVGGVDSIVDLSSAGGASGNYAVVNGAAPGVKLVAGPGITFEYNATTNELTVSVKGLKWSDTTP